MSILAKWYPKVTLYRDMNWKSIGMPLFPERYKNNLAFPDFSDPDYKSADITKYVIDWGFQWGIGNSHAQFSMRVKPINELSTLNSGDIVVVEFNGRKDRFIGAAFLDVSTCNRNVGDKTKTALTFQGYEPGYLMSVHEIYYNPYATGGVIPWLKSISEGISAGTRRIAVGDNPDQRKVILALQEGYPDRMIKKIIDMKIRNVDTSPSGGIWLNDGRKAIDWFDTSGVIDRNDATEGLQAMYPDREIPSDLALKIRNDPAILAYSFQDKSSIEGHIWTILSNFSAKPLWELFTYTDKNSSGYPCQRIIFRPLPFYSEYYGFSLWDYLPVYEFSQSEIIGNESHTRSGVEDANFHMVNSSSGVLSSDNLVAQYYNSLATYGNLGEVRIPVIESRKADKYGLRRQETAINAIPLQNMNSQSTMLDTLKECTFRLWDFNFLNQYFFSAQFSLNLHPDKPVPKIGWKMLNSTTGVEYYLQSIGISGGYNKSTRMTMGCVRGMNRQVYEHLIKADVRRKLLESL